VDAVEEFRTTMLARQAEAEEAFVHGDPRPRMELWSRRDPVTLFGAIGMSESGWDQLGQTFPWVASRFSNVSNFRFDVELVEVSGDMAYTLGFERFDGSIAGRPVEPVAVRVTHVYRREDGEWRIVHRHGDNPDVDPGGSQPRPFVTTPDNAEALDTPAAGALSFRARDEATAGALTAFEGSAAPGEGPPVHRHASEDEAIYVLEGRLRFRLDDTTHDAPAGSMAFIPKGVPHTWQNAGEDRARFLVLFTPAATGMERFFERFAELAGEMRGADAFTELGADAGMTVLGPPLAQSDPLS
jgi:quercetin dioxygenase-like cupin family protein/ketosteroid isomerase-like protein